MFIDYFKFFGVNKPQLSNNDDYVDQNSLTLIAKSGIKIKKKNRGKFTDYCRGKVTDECIQKGKNSSDPAVRKRATFAQNARAWKHQYGGSLHQAGFDAPNLNRFFTSLDNLDYDSYNDKINKLQNNIPFSYISSNPKPIEENNNSEIESEDLMKNISNYTSSSPAVNDDSSVFSHKDLMLNTDGSSRLKYWTDYKKNNQSEIQNAIKHIYDRLISKGLSDSGARAVLAHFNHESAGTFHPRVQNFAGGTDTGIAQWTSGRQNNFYKKYGKKLIDGTLDEQLDFALSELQPYMKYLKSNDYSVQDQIANILPFESGNFNDEDYLKTYHHTKQDSINRRYSGYLNMIKQYKI